MKLYKVVPLALLASISFYSAAEANKPFSAELSIGTTDQESDFNDEDSKPNGDDTSIGLQFGYQISKNFIAEIAYNDYGKIENDYIDPFFHFTSSIETTAIQIGLKAIVPISKTISMFGRAGLSHWTYDLKVSEAGGQSFSENDSGQDFYYGIGLQLDINEQWFTTLSYSITDLDAEISGGSTPTKIDHEIKNLALSIGAHF